MRIKEIQIRGLFDTLDYDLNLDLENHITLLTGANGSGKTVILKMLTEIANKTYHFETLKKIPFDTIEIRFISDDDQTSPDDGHYHSSIKVIREQRSTEATKYVRLIFRYQEYQSKMSRKFHIDGHIPISVEEIPGWFQRLKLFFFPNVTYIDNERPFHKPTSINKETEFNADISERVLAVNMYAQQLVTIIEKELASYSEKAQRLDGSFPLRLMETSIVSQSDTNNLIETLNTVKRKRSDLRKVGLFDQQADVLLPATLDLDPSKTLALSIYLNDVIEKLKHLDLLKLRISLFVQIINERFLGKKINISRQKGFYFTASEGVKLNNENLSAGEQNLVILLYELLFKTTPNSLVLIDEIEMSLHSDWQRCFLLDLRQVNQIMPFDMIISTHSRDILSTHQGVTLHLTKTDSMGLQSEELLEHEKGMGFFSQPLSQ